ELHRGEEALAAFQPVRGMLRVGDAGVVLRRAVAVAGNEQLVARADEMATLRTGVRVALLPLRRRREGCDPARGHAIVDAPRQGQALAHRGAAVARASELPDELEIHLGVGESGHTRPAALQPLIHARHPFPVPFRRPRRTAPAGQLHRAGRDRRDDTASPRQGSASDRKDHHAILGARLCPGRAITPVVSDCMAYYNPEMYLAALRRRA